MDKGEPMQKKTTILIIAAILLVSGIAWLYQPGRYEVKSVHKGSDNYSVVVKCDKWTGKTWYLSSRTAGSRTVFSFEEIE